MPTDNNRQPLRFDRHEFAGAFGDLGTDVPLIILLILTCKLDARSVLIVFGACQVFAALMYHLPVPVQPLKAMATIAIAGGLSGGVLAGGGLAIGAIMLVLSLTGGLGLIARIVPKAVVRGLQFGLGLKLAGLAFQRLPATAEGYILAAVAFLIVVLLRKNRKLPAAIVVVALGSIYTLVVMTIRNGGVAGAAFDPGLPTFHRPGWDDLLTGLVVLAIPQLPLSVGNAILATRQTVSDLFPGREVTVRKLGLTYSAANLIAPLFGGIPVCHGSGGLAGHYTFGGRTGGSVLIYGVTFLILGALFGQGFFAFIHTFPMSLLCVLLIFEGLTMLLFSRDMTANPEDFYLVILVGLLAVGLPYGFCIGVVFGTVLHAWLAHRRRARAHKQAVRSEQTPQP